ncbi:hypothetical protein ACFFVB_03090 [Formosa undariae]|uniref:Peptidase M48 domain-containing protein n=1 Tax=Formosa undariae TaxID=1325436 RepID=A0ABV5EY02_9FLAO
MKKYMYFMLFLVFFTCNKDSKENKTEVDEDQETCALDKEDKLKQLYNATVIPLFSGYNDIDIPTEFQIIEDEMGIDAGASFGYVEVSMGLINVSEESIQLFALTHEVAHIATLSQARLFNLDGYVSSGPETNEYRKSEYLADLIAIHLIKSQEPVYFESLTKNFQELMNILGSGSFTHPSGPNRIKAMQNYIALSNAKTETIAFKALYINIWEDKM